MSPRSDGDGCQGIAIATRLRRQGMCGNLIIRVRRIAVVEIQVRAHAVYPDVGGNNVKQIAVIRTGVVGITARAWPEVLAVPKLVEIFGTLVSE